MCADVRYALQEQASGLLLRELPSFALTRVIRELLPEQVNLLAKLENVADAYHIDALFRELGDLLERGDILI